MFQLTHIYVAEKVLGKNPTMLLGSTLLDLPLVAENYLNWTTFTGRQKWHYNLKNPDLRKGILSHVAVDYISHGKLNKNETDGTGYSFRWFEGRFPELRGMKWHSAPEWFLELYVAKEYPYVFDLFENAVKYADLIGISEDISQALGKNKTKMNHILDEYIARMCEINYATKMFSSTGNPGQGRKECLQACIAAARKAIA